jgi:hypothetical protein
LKLLQIVSVVFLSLSFCAGSIRAESAKLNTSLKFLRHARVTGLAKQDGRRPALAAARADKITVTAKFDHVLSAAEIASFEQQGADFFRVDGAVSHTGPVYAVDLPWDAVDDIARGAAPPRVLLDQNYPNPFNPTTWIPFYLPSDGLVSVKIYNVGGELVHTLREKQMPKGAHSVRWNGDDREGRDVSSGIYFCVLKFGNETQTRKLVLLR